MTRLRARWSPGWLLLLCAAGLAVCSWLPWLTTSADGGGRASAIGGTFGSIVLPGRFGPGQLIALLSSVLIVLAAMIARALSPRLAAVAAVVISILLVALAWWYYRANVHPPVNAGYGLYLGLGLAVAAVLCSVWALASALLTA